MSEAMMAVPFDVFQKLMREASADTFVEAQRASSKVFAQMAWTHRDVATMLRLYSAEPLNDATVADLTAVVERQWAERTERLDFRRRVTKALACTAMRAVAAAESQTIPHVSQSQPGEVACSSEIVVRERNADGTVAQADLRSVSLVMVRTREASR